jgi:hypothetical protein
MKPIVDQEKPKGNGLSWLCAIIKAQLTIGHRQTNFFTHIVGWGTRFTFSLLVWMGFGLCYSVRVDMAVAIVAMVNRSEYYKVYVTINYSELMYN